MKLGKEITGIFPVEGDEDGATIEVILLTPGQEEDIQEAMKAVKTTFKRSADGTMVPEMEANTDLGDKRYLRIIKAVKSWDGFEDKDGKPLECNDANKLSAARESVAFRKTVAEGLKALADEHIAQKESEVKNS